MPPLEQVTRSPGRWPSPAASGSMALAIAALVGWQLPSDSAPQAPFRLAIGLLFATVVPGLGAMRAFGWFSGATGAIEKLPIAFAVGYSLLTAWCAISVVIQWPLTTALLVWAVLIAGVSLVADRVAHAPAIGAPSAGHAAVFVAAAALMACAWYVEAPITGEETVELITIRKIAESPSLTLDGIMPEPRVIPTYVITPYYFFVAMVSKSAGVSMFAAYVKLRAAYAALALLCIAALSRRLFPGLGSRWPDLVAVGVVILFAFDPDPWSWPASLFPLVRRGAIAAGVLAPAFLLAALVFLNPDRARRARGEWLVPALMLVAILSTHATEILYLGFFLAACGVWALLLRDWALLRRFAIFGASTAVGALLYRVAHGRLASHVYEFDAAAKAQALAGLRAELAAGVSSLSGISDAGRYLISASGAVLPGVLIGILMLPLLIRIDRRRFVLPWLIVLLPLLVYSSSKLFAVLQLATSSEILFVFSYFALFGTIAFLAGVHAAAQALTDVLAPRVRPAFGMIAIVLLAGVAAYGLRQAAILVVATPVALPWIVTIAGVAIWKAPGGGLRGPATHTGRVAVAYLVFVAAFAFAIRGFPGKIDGSRRDPLHRQLMDASARPSVLRFEEWYPFLQRNSNPNIDLPLTVIDDLRKLLPPLQTVIADPTYSFALPVVLNQHIVNPGHVISTSLPYFERYARIDGEGRRRHPIFNSSETLSEEERRFLDEYQVRYVIGNPAYSALLKRKLSADGASFELIYERDGFSVYRYRPRA